MVGSAGMAVKARCSGERCAARVVKSARRGRQVCGVVQCSSNHPGRIEGRNIIVGKGGGRLLYTEGVKERGRRHGGRMGRQVILLALGREQGTGIVVRQRHGRVPTCTNNTW